MALGPLAAERGWRQTVFWMKAFTLLAVRDISPFASSHLTHMLLSSVLTEWPRLPDFPSAPRTSGLTTESERVRSL